MTHRDIVREILRESGPASDHAIRHLARAKGLHLTPSSVRTRRQELNARPVGREFYTVNGRNSSATVWSL